ncbi:MAG: phosphonate metabolism protein/1,5-bisphosphokinase (PRPP-forming) PhnN [Nitrosomonas sp.]|jgi:ribose 1,5-bisphosphokinase|nr:phosphonate metabolism protein/1,5-bisphosphokinase (PRPP-forming) PhnN [Nitrosomonas sp.]
MTGRLFYVIGASGAGKDSLMHYAREKLTGRQRIVFTHRYITRPPELVGENHIYLPEAEFSAKQAQGFFAMQWDSHGWRYGIGKEINLWQALDFDVVINGSREYLFDALSQEPGLRVVLIKTSTEVLRERLRKRQRESDAEIERRLQRAVLFNHIEHPNVTVLNNDGTLEQAGETFTQLLNNLRLVDSTV